MLQLTSRVKANCMSALIKSWQVNVSYDVCKRLLVRSLNLGYLALDDK